MASKSKKQVVPGFATLVDEFDFMAWGEAPEWTPKRPVVKAAKLFGKKCDYFAKLPEDVDVEGLRKTFFVVFETVNGKYAKKERVPFYLTKAIVALDEHGEALYRSRYGDALPVMVAADAVRKDMQDTTASRANAQERVNTMQGGERILEMCSLVRPETLPFDEKAIFDFCGGNAAETAGIDVGLRTLLEYSRHAPNFPDNLLGAVCDVGTIMRGLAKDENDNEQLRKLGALVNAAKADGSVFSFSRLTGLVDAGFSFPLLRPCFVIYLYWKYLAEQKDGAIDFERLLADVEELRQTALDASEWAGAVWLLGAMAGFKSFSAQYHAFKREQLHRSKANPAKREPPIVEIKLTGEVKPMETRTN